MSEPVARVLGSLDRVRQNGQGWMARCPAHDDGTNSLKVDEGDDGTALVHCHAGCTQEAIVKALGLTMADLFEHRHGGSPRPPAITLAQLARAKRLPEAWLAQTLGWYDLPGGGVGIPYRDETGKPLHVKRRTALKAKEGSYWPKGVQLMAYGLEGLAAAREAGSLILVEGETDTATLRYHGFPVLGIPGADGVKVLQADHLKGVHTIYAWQEPDAGGATFVQRLAVRLATLGYQGHTKVIRLEGVKDASELHSRDPEGFQAAMRQAMATAADLPDNDSAEGDPHARRPVLISMADVEPEPVTWLWEPYIPLGKVTILEGDPGEGKTWLALTIAAAVSCGRTPYSGEPRSPADVIYLTAEDGLGDTLRPRLEVSGADLTRIHCLTGWASTMDDGKEVSGCVTLADVELLEQVLADRRPALLVIDPLQAYIGAQVDIHRANETRPILTGLAVLAARYGCAILIIRHLSKASQDRAVYRGLGSIDFSAAVRSVLMAGKNPERPADTSSHVMAHAKSNLAPIGESLTYETREGRFL
jgi:putative DNA primase/helicase